MKGSVKFFNDMKNFGFIAGEDGKEYFVHSTGLKENVTIKEGDSVAFDVEEGDRGPKAVNVSIGKDEDNKEEANEEEASKEDVSKEEASKE